MSKIKYHYTATLSQRSSVDLSSGTLIVGQTYRITYLHDVDDFSNISNVISGVINTEGCYFIATGTTPLIWVGSTLTTFGNPWTNFLDTNLENTTWNYFSSKNTQYFFLQTNKLIDPAKTSVSIGNRFELDGIVTSSYFFSDNFKINTNFNTGVDREPSGFNGSVQDIIYFKDNEITKGFIIGGQFSLYLGSPCFCLVKLNSDGSILSNFKGGIDYTAEDGQFNHTIQVRSIKLQRDGKLLVGGVIGSYNTTHIRSCLIRINTDYSLDNTFKRDGFNFIIENSEIVVNTIAIQNDDKILVGGLFNVYDGYVSKFIIRLNLDGTVDTKFNSQRIGFDGQVNIIVIQPDGKILVGGDFATYNEISSPYLTRLNSDGSVDLHFVTEYYNTGFLDQRVNKIVLESDGSILVGGRFTENLIRFNSDGTRNNNFTPFNQVVSGRVSSLNIQSDNKILVGFSNNDGGTRTTLKRFDKYSVLEDGFNITCNGVISTVLEKDGMIYLGGDLNSITLYDSLDSTTYSTRGIFSLDSTTKFNLITSRENFSYLSLDIKFYD